eukprot:CAMPEP_0176380446 /NCGR_PEP_ID=MMETSP0126-20121128/31136_1 /TAXON_ID=141414 ORGANISM="Strombidinopsis acuminatum, Strain SPMC142" /NCGR_SAMPLE_ID=MMETSP0126 /ASSEMBLY_ACC=CAM_ASM_000229 /LENGTH=107 /DNA_ID=CAMNT_0017743771 /DNA_START=341 /DNA_END=664 /DNA_ORIENTATION=+
MLITSIFGLVANLASLLILQFCGKIKNADGEEVSMMGQINSTYKPHGGHDHGPDGTCNHGHDHGPPKKKLPSQQLNLNASNLRNSDTENVRKSLRKSTASVRSSMAP